MPTTTMTPEEILKYAKRVVLFQNGRRRNNREFVIEDNRIYQQVIQFVDGKKCIIKTNPVEIGEIYNQIERVYSQKSKGVLIAKRSGNYKSNQKQLLPLKKTGKGMGEALRGTQLATAVYQLSCERDQSEAVKKRAKQRIEKAKREEQEKKRLRQEKKTKRYA